MLKILLTTCLLMLVANMGCESQGSGPIIQETGTNGDGDTDSDTDGDTDSDTDGDSDTDADNDTDTDADNDTDTDADNDADTDADNDTDTDVDNDVDGDTDNDTDSDSDGDADNNTGPECVDFPWEVETKPINMLVLLDRSKSMEKYTIAGTDESYADVVQAAIDAIVQQHTNSGIINFALNVFPSPAMCDIEYGNKEAADQSAAILCQAASQYTTESNPFNEPEVPFDETITMDTYSAIQKVLDEVGNCGGTPISKSLQWARNYLNSLDLENDTYILLATDGAPGCNLNAELPCESSTPNATAEAPAQCLDDMDSIHAVFDLAKDGYKTFVVGVGEDIAAFADIMNVIAYTGGGHLKEDQPSLYEIEDPPEGKENWYYPAADSETLNNALEEVTNEAISCVYEVDWESIPKVDPNTNLNVIKSCSQMRVFGVPIDDEEKIELTYMQNCNDEDPESENERQQMGWTWEELEGKSWDSVEEIGSDTSQCIRVKLCENACAKLKTIEGVKEWDAVSASFGCQPIII